MTAPTISNAMNSLVSNDCSASKSPNQPMYSSTSEDSRSAVWVLGRMIERAGEAAALPFPVHVHMLRHSTGYALAGKGMDTRRLQHFLGHASITNTVRYTAMSPKPFKDIWR